MYKAFHQSIRESEKLAKLTDFAYRVWHMGCTAADPVGRITANPKLYWAQAMPLVDFDQAKYADAIKQIVDARLAHAYSVDGKAFIVFHDHDDHNKGQRNLRNIKAGCPPPVPDLCYCVVYTRDEEDRETVPNEESLPEGAALAQERQPEQVRPVIRHLHERAKSAKVAGRKETILSYIEAWVARTDAQKVEQVLMDPWSRGKTVLEIQEHYFNGQSNGVDYKAQAEAEFLKRGK